MSDDDLTPAEQQELQSYLQQLGMGAGYPQPEKDKSMIGFFRDLINHKVLKRTFRSGNLEADTELFSVRTYMDTAHYADRMGLSGVGEFLEEEALIITDTSLSKDGFLIKAAITQKRESRTLLGETKKQKKGSNFWSGFGKKKSTDEGGE